MQLNSNQVTTKKSKQELYEFLRKVKNFEQIMPDNISKFEAAEDSFVFALKGMPEIELKITEEQPYDKLVLGAASGKLPFTLTANISGTDDNAMVALVFEGKFNAMMAMMVKAPLTKFINTLSENLEDLA
jgi:hypothetical protein